MATPPMGCLWFGYVRQMLKAVRAKNRERPPKKKTRASRF